MPNIYTIIFVLCGLVISEIHATDAPSPPRPPLGESAAMNEAGEVGARKRPLPALPEGHPDRSRPPTAQAARVGANRRISRAQYERADPLAPRGGEDDPETLEESVALSPSDSAVSAASAAEARERAPSWERPEEEEDFPAEARRRRGCAHHRSWPDREGTAATLPQATMAESSVGVLRFFRDRRTGHWRLRPQALSPAHSEGAARRARAVSVAHSLSPRGLAAASLPTAQPAPPRIRPPVPAPGEERASGERATSASAGLGLAPPRPLPDQSVFGLGSGVDLLGLGFVPSALGHPSLPSLMGATSPVVPTEAQIRAMRAADHVRRLRAQEERRRRERLQRRARGLRWNPARPDEPYASSSEDEEDEEADDEAAGGGGDDEEVDGDAAAPHLPGPALTFLEAQGRSAMEGALAEGIIALSASSASLLLQVVGDVAALGLPTVPTASEAAVATATHTPAKEKDRKAYRLRLLRSHYIDILGKLKRIARRYLSAQGFAGAELQSRSVELVRRWLTVDSDEAAMRALNTVTGATDEVPFFSPVLRTRMVRQIPGIPETTALALLNGAGINALRAEGLLTEDAAVRSAHARRAREIQIDDGLGRPWGSEARVLATAAAGGTPPAALALPAEMTVAWVREQRVAWTEKFRTFSTNIMADGLFTDRMFIEQEFLRLLAPHCLHVRVTTAVAPEPQEFYFPVALFIREDLEAIQQLREILSALQSGRSPSIVHADGSVELCEVHHLSQANLSACVALLWSWHRSRAYPIHPFGNADDSLVDRRSFNSRRSSSLYRFGHMLRLYLATQPGGVAGPTPPPAPAADGDASAVAAAAVEAEEVAEESDPEFRPSQASAADADEEDDL